MYTVTVDDQVVATAKTKREATKAATQYLLARAQPNRGEQAAKVLDPWGTCCNMVCFTLRVGQF